MEKNENINVKMLLTLIIGLVILIGFFSMVFNQETGVNYASINQSSMEFHILDSNYDVSYTPYTQVEKNAWMDEESNDSAYYERNLLKIDNSSFELNNLSSIVGPGFLYGGLDLIFNLNGSMNINITQSYTNASIFKSTNIIVNSSGLFGLNDSISQTEWKSYGIVLAFFDTLTYLVLRNNTGGNVDVLTVTDSEFVFTNSSDCLGITLTFSGQYELLAIRDYGLDNNIYNTIEYSAELTNPITVLTEEIELESGKYLFYANNSTINETLTDYFIMINSSTYLINVPKSVEFSSNTTVRFGINTTSAEGGSVSFVYRKNKSATPLLNLGVNIATPLIIFGVVLSVVGVYLKRGKK